MGSSVRGDCVCVCVGQSVSAVAVSPRIIHTNTTNAGCESCPTTPLLPSTAHALQSKCTKTHIVSYRITVLSPFPLFPCSPCSVCTKPPASSALSLAPSIAYIQQQRDHLQVPCLSRFVALLLSPSLSHNRRLLQRPPIWNRVFACDIGNIHVTNLTVCGVLCTVCLCMG